MAQPVAKRMRCRRAGPRSKSPRPSWATRVRVVRRGGLAGIPLRGEVDTAEFSGDQAKTIESTLHGLPFDKPPAPPRHPDGFQYALEFPDASGESRSVTLDESEIAENLRPVIQTAMERGTLG